MSTSDSKLIIDILKVIIAVAQIVKVNLKNILSTTDRVLHLFVIAPIYEILATPMINMDQNVVVL